MSARFDVIVVGVGTMGAAACAELARRGARVLGLERFDIPNAMGAHHGHSRIFRVAYFEHADYVPLLKRARELWARLGSQSSQPIFHVTGALYLGPPESDTIGRTAASAQVHGVPIEMLTRRQVAERFGQFRVPGDFVGLFEPGAGLIIPELAVGALATRALFHGAELRGRERVMNWSSDDSGVTVRTDRSSYRADRLVLTAGPWSGALARDLGVSLRVTRQIVGWVWPKRPDLFQLGLFPVWAVESRDQRLHYGFPMLPWHPGLKLAWHHQGVEADPDAIERVTTSRDEEEFRPFLSEALPDADGPTLSMGVCMYTNSPDSHFIIDRHPAHAARVVLACGFSGHGSKFAPVVGEALADLALQGRTELPIGFLGLHRFGGAGR